MNGKTKKIIQLVIIGALAVSLLISVVGLSFAVWRNTREATQTTPVPTENWNDSLKYQVFAPLDADGNFISGEVIASEMASVAIVGYTGLVSRVEIPYNVSISIGGSNYVRSVTRVLFPPDGSVTLYMNGTEYTGTRDIKFENNRIITELIVGGAVTNIAGGVFQSMIEVEKLTLAAGPLPVHIGDMAFYNLKKLTRENYLSERGIEGNQAMIFLGTFA